MLGVAQCAAEKHGGRLMVSGTQLHSGHFRFPTSFTAKSFCSYCEVDFPFQMRQDRLNLSDSSQGNTSAYFWFSSLEAFSDVRSPTVSYSPIIKQQNNWLALTRIFLPCLTKQPAAESRTVTTDRSATFSPTGHRIIYYHN